MNGQTQALPDKLLEIAEVVGMEPAMKFAAAWPGVRVFVPKQMTPDHPIAVAMGYQPALLLSHYFGGDSLVPPMLTRYHRQLLNAKIIDEYRGGASAAELARKYGRHQFSIYNLVSQVEQEKQQSLF